LAQDLEEFGKVEQMPRFEGKRMTMFLISPKKGKIVLAFNVGTIIYKKMRTSRGHGLKIISERNIKI
jgi:hypothetical protein